MFVFPEDGDAAAEYEHDEPYEVLYCADRDCGQRKTKVLSVALAEEVREFNGFPNEEILGGGE
jgi:hypothetical protein